jgi:probable phosphoglycerate mutase
VATDSPPTRITLIRHGESNVTVQRIIGGHRTCTGLSDLGRRQSERLARRLGESGELAADVLVSSDFARAVETAEIVAPAIGITDIDRWPDFGEHDPGPEIDGMTFDEYVARFGTPDWTGDPDVEIFPGGETTAVFHERVRAAVRRLRDTYAGAHVAVACHGGVVDAVFRDALDLPATGGFSLHTLNTSLTEFVAPDESVEPWRLVRYNDSAHLAGLPAATGRATT